MRSISTLPRVVILTSDHLDLMTTSRDKRGRIQTQVPALRLAAVRDEFEREDVIYARDLVNDLQHLGTKNVAPERPTSAVRPAAERVEEPIDGINDLLLQARLVHARERFG